MIAGFETPTEGSIRIDGRDVTHLSARRRAIGMVFQAYALFPNMTVERNIGFGLKVAGKPAAEIKARVDEMLALIKLSDLAGRFPLPAAMKPPVTRNDEPDFRSRPHSHPQRFGGRRFARSLGSAANSPDQGATVSWSQVRRWDALMQT
jgi:ABC-type glutathione transport system ATPase component